MEFVTRATHPPARPARAVSTTLGADLLVVGHTHEPMWYPLRAGLVVNPGSVVSMPVVKTSRTFALVDLAELDGLLSRRRERRGESPSSRGPMTDRIGRPGPTDRPVATTTIGLRVADSR